MNKEKAILLAKMQELKDKRESEISNQELDIKIVDVKYLGKIKWIDEQDESRVEKEKDIFMIIEDRNGSMVYKYYDENMEMIAAQMSLDNNLLPNKKFLSKEDKSFLKDIEDLDKVGESLEDLKREKEKEEKGKTKNADKKKDTKEERKNDLTGKKTKGIVQRIDPNKAYVNSVETVSNAYGISSDVDELVIADTQAGDENALSDNKTIYMLDKDDKIIEKSNGKKINELFEYDDSTGKNPMYDDNTKIELAGHAERNKGQTMARFRSKENPDLYLSAEQKKWGNYAQVYAEQKTRDGNDAVGIELETDNSAIQTDLEKQKIMGYGSGDYKKEYVDEEADMHDEEHGDDEMNIAIANADGNELTREMCDNPFVPDTNITWEQFSKSIGDKDINELMKEFFEQYNGNNGQELILKIQSDYKEQKDIEKTSKIEKEEDLDRFREGPWEKQ